MRPITLVSMLGLVVLGLTSIYFIIRNSDYKQTLSSSSRSPQHQDSQVIMQFMGNKTEKAELGRATWKFLHTMMARYPEKPTDYERESLRDFMHLFSKLYPCGECAGHFQKLLQQFPPQTSSRVAASQWLCAMHNKVNERLDKPIFDCGNIEAKYPCGCDAEEEPATTAERGEQRERKERKETEKGKKEEEEEEEEEEIIMDSINA